MSIFEVRVFDASGGDYRILPLKVVAPGLSWRIDKKMGYAEGYLNVYGDALVDWVAVWLTASRRVEFWSGGNRLYRGYIKFVAPGESSDSGVLVSRVTLAGRFELISTHRVRRRFAIFGGRDAGDYTADLINNFVIPNEANPLVVASDITGVTLDSLDAWDITFGEALARILDAAGGGLVAGCDVDENGIDRFFLRSIGSTGTGDASRHVITIPSRTTGRVDTEQDAATINTLHFQGGDARYVNYVAQAVNGNSSFEYPILSKDSPGNLLVNSSFENINRVSRTPDDWTTSVNIIKATNEGFGAPFSGRYFVRLNGSGEFVSQTSANPDTNVIEGQDYTFQIWMKRLTSVNPLVTLSIAWLDSGGSTISTDDVGIIPQDTAEWFQYSCPGHAPTGATAYRVRAELTTASGEGVVLDAPSFFQTSGVTSLGWECAKGDSGGTGVINAIDWAYTGVPAHHGAYSVYLNVNATDTGDDDIELRPASQSKFTLREGALFRFSVWVRKAPGETNHPKVRLQLQYFGEDGQFNTSDEADFAAGTDWDNWSKLEWEGTVEPNTAFCWPLVKIRGNGKLLIDAVQVTDQAADSSVFQENVQFLDTVDVRNVFNSSDPEYLAHVDSSGNIPQVRSEIIENSSVTTRGQAVLYGRAYLAAHALGVTRKHIPTYRFYNFWPGDYVRAIGKERGKLPVPLPVAEVTGEYTDKVTLTAHLGEERLTETRLLREINRKLIRQSKQGSPTGGRPNRL